MNQARTLQQWLQHIESRRPGEIDLGLERVREVAARLGLDWHNATCVVVAGTNGKGSTVAALEGIFRQHGLSVGCYTSPHIHQFNERIVIDGCPLQDDALCQAFSAVEAARQEQPLTFFEFTTLAALYCFSIHQPHIWVLEVGLGGRLDAVNIVDGDVTLVTNIAMDHEAWLGSDRESIGREKAGIFRRGIPAIYAEADAPQSVMAAAEALDASWLQYGQAFELEQGKQGWQWQGPGRGGSPIVINGEGELSLHAEAVAGAIQAALQVLDNPQPALIAQGVEGAALPGRCEFRQARRCEFVFDVAHNPAAVTRLVTTLAARPCRGKTHLIFAMLEDKRVQECLALLEPLVDGQICLPQLETARASEATSLVGKPGRADVIGGRVDKVVDKLLERVKPADRVVVSGSFYTVAAVTAALQQRGEGFE